MRLSPRDYPPKYLTDWINEYEHRLCTYNENSDEEIGKISESIKQLKLAVNDRTNTIIFLKDILLSGDMFCDDGMNMVLNLKSKKIYPFTDIRIQMYASLFCAIGGVNDIAARTCEYALNTADNKLCKIRPEATIQNIFSLKNKAVISYYDIIKVLMDNYGYFLGIIIYLRNYYIHRGTFNGKNFFDSNECSGMDIINPYIIKDIENAANSEYEILKYQTHGNELTNYAGKSFIELLENYLLYSDHAIGILLNSLIIKQLSAIPPNK